MMEQIVLMYHDIIPGEDYSSGMHVPAADTYKVNVERFEEQVRAIHQYLTDNKLPLEKVVFSFDDGGYTFLTEAAPVLEKYGFKGLFFITSSFVGQEGFLTAVQVKELEERGHEVASHSHTHNTEMTELGEKELYEEWKQSVDVLSGIVGKDIKAASLPRGDGSKKVCATVFSTGIQRLYTSVPTTKVEEDEKGNRIIGRFVVHRDTRTEEVLEIVTNETLRTKMYRRWKLIDCVKRIMGGKNYMRLKSLIVKS